MRSGIDDRYHPRCRPECRRQPQRGRRERRARHFLRECGARFDARWVNHPDKNRVAESKLNQLRVASKSCGFEVPATLVTNDAQAVQEFIAAQPTGVICKPLSDGHVPVGDEEHVFFTSV